MRTISPSSHPGMGALPFSAGCAFRVWAPFAEQVFVTGTFNKWSEDCNPLVSEGKGYWSVDVAGAQPGDEYKYVLVSDSFKAWRIDPYAKKVTNSVGNSVIVNSEFDWGQSDFQIPNWNEMVIYELHIGTFNDQPGGAPGNLNGVIERLPHLSELGINTIKVMPPTEFAGAFSWGYNPAHIFAIESDYGGPQAFKEFIKTAHSNGIAVIFDVVYNHLGPSDLDLWQFDGWQENDKGGIFFYNDSRSSTPWGDTRPDYGRPEVRQYLRDNALMWLEEYRVDGLRWDATAYIRNVHGNTGDAFDNLPAGNDLMRWINDEINTRQPWKISIAEDLRNDASLTKETSQDGSGFDSQWDAKFVHPIRKVIITPDDHNRNMYEVKDAILHQYNNNAFERIIYTESHDEVANGKARVPQEIWADEPASYFSRKRSTLGAAMVFTAPGIPMIFQGQEFLEDEWFRDTDPIDWVKKETFNGIYLLYRDLIRLRRNWYNNTRGLQGQHVNVHHINNADKVIAYHRWQNGGYGDDVIVIVNMANTSYNHYTIGFPREGLWKIRFNSDWSGYSDDFTNHFSFDTIAHQGSKDGLPCNANVGLGPYSVVILSQENE